MYCSKCGKEIKEGTMFCGGCGAPVGNTDAARNQPTDGVQEKAKPNRKNLIIGITATTVVLLAGSVCAAVFYNKQKDDSIQTTNASMEDNDSREEDKVFDQDSSISLEEVSDESQEIENGQSDDSLTAEEQYEKPLRQKIWYDYDGDIARVYDYSYDDSGNMTKEIRRETTYSLDRDLEFEYTYRFDGNGNRIKEVWYEGYNYDWIRYEYCYDDAGSLLREVCYDDDSDNTLVYEIEYEYNGEGRLAKEIKYNWDGNVSSWYEYTYDNDGRLLEKADIYDGKKRTWYEYGYDDEGNTAREVWYFSYDGSIRQWYEWEYDGNGNQIEFISCDSDGKMQYWSESEYDSEGNLIKHVRYNSDGSVANWTEYSYDGYGNMLGEIWYGSDGSVNGRMEYIRDEEDELDDSIISQLAAEHEDREYVGFTPPQKDTNYAGADWKKAYKEFLETEAEVPDWDNYPVVGLGYVDDDDIPELFIAEEVGAYSVALYTFQKGEVKYLDSLGGQGASISYDERNNLVMKSGAMMGSTHILIYRLIDGELQEVGYAHYDMAPWQRNDYGEGEFYWNDDIIIEEEYYSRWDALASDIANYETCDMTLEELYVVLNN